MSFQTNLINTFLHTFLLLCSVLLVGFSFCGIRKIELIKFSKEGDDNDNDNDSYDDDDEMNEKFHRICDTA